MFVAWKNPNPPYRSKPVVFSVQTIPASRTYMVYGPQTENYLTVLDGNKPRFSMSAFLGGKQ
jgi:hypothetical protein